MEPKPILILSNLPNDVGLDDVKKLFTDHNVVQANMKRKDNIPIAYVELTNFEQILNFLSSRENVCINNKQIDIDLLKTADHEEIIDSSSSKIMEDNDNNEINSTPLSIIKPIIVQEPVKRSIESEQCDAMLESPLMITNAVITDTATVTALNNNENEKKLEEEKKWKEEIANMIDNLKMDHELIQKCMNEIQYPKMNSTNKVDNVKSTTSTSTSLYAPSKEPVTNTSNSTVAVWSTNITNNHIVTLNFKTPITLYKYHSLVSEYPPFVAHLTNLPSDAKIDDIFKILPKNLIEFIAMPLLPQNSNRILGIAYVEFTERYALLAALELPEPEINDIEIQINYYKHEIPKQFSDKNEYVWKKLHTSNDIQDNKSVQQIQNTGIKEQKQSIIDVSSTSNNKKVSTNTTPTKSSYNSSSSPTTTTPPPNNSSTSQNMELHQMILKNIHSNTLDSELKNYIQVFGNIKYPIEIVREFAGSNTAFVNLQTLEDVKRTMSAINNAGLSVYGEYIEQNKDACENKKNQSDNQKQLETKSNAVLSSNVSGNGLHPPFVVVLYNPRHISDSEIRHLFSDFKILSLRNGPNHKFIEFSKGEELTKVLNSKWSIGSMPLRFEMGNRTKEINHQNTQIQSQSYNTINQRNDRNPDLNKVPNDGHGRNVKSPIKYNKAMMSEKKEYSMLLRNLPGMNNPILNNNVAIQNIIANHGKIKYPIKIERYNGEVYAFLHTITDLQYVVMVINNGNLGIKAQINEEQRVNKTIPANYSKSINPIANVEMNAITNYEIKPITCNQMQSTKTTTVSTTSVVVQTSNEFNKCNGQSCIKCLKFANLKCERCFRYYCSADCQQVDWPYHSVICMPMPKLIDGSVPASTNNKIACLLNREQLNQIEAKGQSRNNGDRTHQMQRRRRYGRSIQNRNEEKKWEEAPKRMEEEEKRKQDQKRMEEEEKRKQDQKRIQEEEKRKQDQKRMEEEEKRKQDQKRMEEEKRKQDQKRMEEEEKRKQDQKRMEEEKRKQNQKRIQEEEKRKQDQKRIKEEEKRKQDQKRMEEEEKRKQDQKRIKEEEEKRKQEAERLQREKLEAETNKLREAETRKLRELVEQLQQEIKSQRLAIDEQKRLEEKESKSKEYVERLVEEKIMHILKDAKDKTDAPKPKEMTTNEEMIARINTTLAAIPKSVGNNQSKANAIDNNESNSHDDEELKMKQENERKREEVENKRDEENPKSVENEQAYLENIIKLLKDVNVRTETKTNEIKSTDTDDEIGVELQSVTLTDAIVKSDDKVSTTTNHVTTDDNDNDNDEKVEMELRRIDTIDSLELTKMKETLRVLEEERNKTEIDKLKEIECSKEKALAAAEMQLRDNPEYQKEMQLKQFQENCEIEQLREKVALDEFERSENRRQLIERIRQYRDAQDKQKTKNVELGNMAIQSLNDGYQQGYIPQTNQIVVITAVLSAKLLVIRSDNDNKEYQELLDTIRIYSEHTFPLNAKPMIGEMVLVNCKSNYNSDYYRAIVIEFVDDTKLIVVSIDYGYLKLVKIGDLRFIEPALKNYKRFATQVTLSRIDHCLTNDKTINYLETLMNDGKRLKITLQEPFNTSIGTCELFLIDTMESINDAIIKLSEK